VHSGQINSILPIGGGVAGVKNLNVGARDSDRDGCRCHLQTAKAKRRRPHWTAQNLGRAHRAG